MIPWQRRSRFEHCSDAGFRVGAEYCLTRRVDHTVGDLGPHAEAGHHHVHVRGKQQGHLLGVTGERGDDVAAGVRVHLPTELGEFPR